MPTAPKGYFLADGTKVPSVTTVLSRFKESGGLIHWAWKLGCEGKDYRQVRDTAASIGTIAHEMVECDIRGREFDASQYDAALVAKARNSFEAFLEWRGAVNLIPAETEIRLVSEKHRYGGTPDVFFVHGKRTLGDWKSSDKIYPEYMVQLAAYRELWNETHPNDLCEPGGHLLRFDKTHGDFHHHFWRDLDEAWEAFKHMRALYDLMKGLEKRAA